MGGSFLQLVAKGNQDKPLTGNPQMTFFKSIYKRHTNFASESIEVPLEGEIKWGMKCKCTVPRKGDLIGDMYLKVILPKITVSGSYPVVRWVDKPGHALIDYVELYIGNELIDRHTGEWLEIWSQLSLPEDKKLAYHNMIGHKGSLISEQVDSINPHILYIPLMFWFCKNTGLALPIVALQYHDVEVVIKFKDVNTMYQVNDVSSVVTVEPLQNVTLYINYYYLDTEERKRFALSGHKYLIEQVQKSEDHNINSSKSVKLNFNHPVKELIWVGQRNQAITTTYSKNADDYSDYNDLFNYTSSASISKKFNMFESFVLQLNGMDLFSEREPQYFNMYVPYRHHTRAPDVGVFVHTFSENPEEYQPSGTCNFSRLDSAVLKYNLNGLGPGPKLLKVYAVNYNILEIKGGQCALAYTH